MRIPITAVLDTALEATQSLVDDANIVVSVSVRPRSLAVATDPRRVAEDVAKLVTDAAKRTERGGRIAIEAALVDGEVVVTVADAGSVRIPDAEPPSEKRGLRLLMIDDDKDLLAMFIGVLRAVGYDAHSARGGIAGLSAAERLRPDAILVDIGMPDLDGFEVARRIRATEWGARLVLVALTGWGEEDVRRRTQAAGFDEHLTKPIDPDKLQATLDACKKR